MTSGTALRDRRRLAGELLVRPNAQILAGLRFLERETFRLLDGWMALTPEWDVKLATGKHAWEGAQHAARLGSRLVELRAPARGMRVPAILGELVEAVDRSSDTLERLVAVYRVLKPLLATAYVELAARTSAVSDAPTVDLLGELAPRLERQIRWGESWIAELACDLASRERALGWQLELERYSVAVREALDGGASDAALMEAEPPPPSPRWVEGRSYEPRVKVPLRDKRFKPLMNIRNVDPDDHSEAGLVSLMHLMAQSELGAAEVIGRLPYEHPEMPFEFHYDMARQTWDEVRHCEAAWKRLEALGGHLGMFPEKHGGHYERRMSLDLHHRLAIQGPVEEATANASFKGFTTRALARGDFETALLYDYVVADETTHVRFQSKWLAWLANHDAATQRRWIQEAKQLSEAWYERAFAEEQRMIRFIGLLDGRVTVESLRPAVPTRLVSD